MEEQIEAIVLRCIKHGDHGMVVQTLSENGRESFYIKNVRKGSMFLFYPLSMVRCTVTKRKGMATVTETTKAEDTVNIRNDIFRYAIAQYISELLLRTLHDGPHEKGFYTLACSTATLLNSIPSGYANLHLFFTVRMAALLGYMPENNYSSEKCIFSLEEASFVPETYNAGEKMNLEESRLLHGCMGTIEQALATETSSKTRTGTLEKMLRFISMHSMTDLNLNSLDVLKEVFAP